MHFTTLLLTLAATSYAFYMNAEPAESSWQSPRQQQQDKQRRMPRRALHFPLRTFHKCPEGHSKDMPESVALATLNSTSLAAAQEQLMDWCDHEHGLDPSAGSDGQTITVDDVSVQICNMHMDHLPCTSGGVKELLEAIECGTREAPRMGIALQSETVFAVAYGPKGKLPKCQEPPQMTDSMGLGDGPWFNGADCGSGAWC